jgi:hypothetical protein
LPTRARGHLARSFEDAAGFDGFAEEEPKPPHEIECAGEDLGAAVRLELVGNCLRLP